MIADSIFSYSDTGWLMKILSFFNSTDNKIIATLLIVAALFIIVEVVIWWRIFEKAGKHGFTCLIPLYNIMVLLNITNQPGYYFILMLIPLVNLIPLYQINMNLAREFHKQPSFGWGLLLLNPIFLIILAFDNSDFEKDYYYTNVKASNVAQVINKTLIEDYNQGLIFDPSTNVEDVVLAAPYEELTNEEINEMSKGVDDMAFFGMSEEAKNNMSGGIPDMEVPTYSAQVQEPNANVNMQANNNTIQQESIIPSHTITDVPQKMSMEQLLGISKEPKIEEPVSEDNSNIKQSAIDANMIFNMNNSQMAPTQMSGNVSPIEQNQQFIPQQNEADIINNAQMDANNSAQDDINSILGIDQSLLQAVPISNDIPTISQTANTVQNPQPLESISNSTNSDETLSTENVSNGTNSDESFLTENINNILGIDPNTLEAVPISNDSSAIPTIVGESTSAIPEVAQAQVAQASVIPEVAETPVAQASVIPEVAEAPVAPTSVIPEVAETPVAQTPVIPEVAETPVAPTPVIPEVNTNDSIQHETVNITNTSMDVIEDAANISNQIPASIDDHTTISNIDLGIPKVAPVSEQAQTSDVIPEVVSTPNPTTINQVKEVSPTEPKIINSATAVAESIPIVTPQLQVSTSNEKFDINNIIQTSPPDEEPKEVGKIASFVGQPDPTIKAPNPDVDIFIPNSEEEIKPPESKICSNCGTKLVSEAKFCYLCGKAV